MKHLYLIILFFPICLNAQLRPSGMEPASAINEVLISVNPITYKGAPAWQFERQGLSHLISTDANNGFSIGTDGKLFSSGSGADNSLSQTDQALPGNRKIDTAGNDLTIEGTGNVGIGTATPAKRLHVVGEAIIRNAQGSTVIGQGAGNAGFFNAVNIGEGAGMGGADIAIGYQALQDNTLGGTDMFAIGYQSGKNAQIYPGQNGRNNTFLGNSSGMNSQTKGGTYLGYWSGKNGTLEQSTATGSASAENANARFSGFYI